MKPPAIFLMGPTASGKTAIATELVQDFPFEIVSVDSAMVFRHMNIGTAKPDAETLSVAPHHLIDIIDPAERYSAGQFQLDATRLMGEITQRGKIPLLVGGTMLYFKALSEGLNTLPRADLVIRGDLDEKAKRLGWPELHRELARIDPVTASRLEPTDSQRIQRALEIWLLSGVTMTEHLLQEKEAPPYNFTRIALVPSDRAVLHQRIALRFESMLQAGLIGETEYLRKEFELDPSMPSMRAVGYRQAWQYLDGEFGRSELIDKGIAATRQLAKRQLTWLRSMDNVKYFDCIDPRSGHNMNVFLHEALE